MTRIIPTVGRIVLYTMARFDVESINAQRASETRYPGNAVIAGEVYPAMIVRGGDQPDSYVNLKVMLDGHDCYWATSRMVGDPSDQGTYHWMGYQLGQAAKTEAAEKALSDKGSA